MKTKLALASAVLFLSWALLPLPWFGMCGAYNAWSGLTWVTSKPSIKKACWIHEKGHELDDLSGWVSRTDEFQHEVSALADMGLALQANSQEDYAYIFQLANGQRENMPLVLQEFYDWELAEKLLEKYKEKTW